MEIQLVQVLFQMVNFFVVLGALTYLLYKPVLKVFDERAKRIEEGQKAADAAIKSQENLEQLKKEAQAQIKKERSETLKESQVEAKAQAKNILAEARAQAESEVEKMKKAWEVEKRQMTKDLRAEMTQAVITVSESVISKSLNAKSQKSLIDSELDAILKQL